MSENYTLNLPSADGSNGQVLKTDGSGNLSWTSNSSSPTTTQGDIIYRGASADGRLAIGASGRFLYTNGTQPSWAEITASNISNFELGGLTDGQVLAWDADYYGVSGAFVPTTVSGGGGADVATSSIVHHHTQTISVDDLASASDTPISVSLTASNPYILSVFLVNNITTANTDVTGELRLLDSGNNRLFVCSDISELENISSKIMRFSQSSILVRAEGETVFTLVGTSNFTAGAGSVDLHIIYSELP